MIDNYFFFFEKNLNLIDYKNYSEKNIYKKQYKSANTVYNLVLNLFFKRGLKKKHVNIFFNIIQKIKLNIIDDTNYSKELVYNFNSMNRFNNINFLLLWALSNINVTFQIVSKEVPKKYKNKNKYIFNLRYVFKQNRQKVRFFLIKKYYISIQKSLKFSLLKIVFDLLFNYKNSPFYINKIKLYNKLLK